jgi:hypothetical protein
MSRYDAVVIGAGASAQPQRSEGVRPRDQQKGAP